MLAKNKLVIKNHRIHVRTIIKKLLAKQSFKITKKIKFGPRYFVAEGNLDSAKALFKICLYPKSYDHLTNEKFSREILFLDFINNSHYAALKKSTPQIYYSSVGTRSWYFREYLVGKTYNINDGNIRFTDSFFTKKNLDWFTQAFTELQSIQPKDLPLEFKKLLFPPQTLSYLWRFIGPYYLSVEKFTGIKGGTAQIKKLFKKYGTMYASAPRVLAHQEVYAPHILKTKKYIKIIDWENIGWSLPTHDIVTMWMRANRHPAWQRQLYNKFKKFHRHYKKFDDLWTITVLTQSVFNVIAFHFYKDKKDFVGLANYSSKKIHEILTNTYKA